tara:strand:+ start:985 stop:2571 length:1587 start_codon:yes stop_codon:yes gene_type:complete
MPNLENIHYKFFPKSRTSPLGKKLIYGAWFIEIIVAMVSLSIAYALFYTNALGFDVPVAERMIISLALVVVAVMELTKIPLVTALYYSGKWVARSIFIILLVFANYSTFETMIQAFDVSVYNQLQKVNVERQKLINTERKIELLREEIDLDKKNNQLNILKLDRDKTLQTKNELSIKESEEIQRVLNEYNFDNTVLQTLEKNRSSKINDKNKLQDLKSKAEISIKDVKTGFLGLGGGSNRKSIENQIEDYKVDINRLNDEIINLESKIEKAQRQTVNKSTPIIENIRLKYKTLLIPIDNDFNQLNKAIESKQTEITNISKKTEEVNQKILFEQESLREQSEIVEEKSKGSNILRISLRIKNRPEWIGGAGGSYKISDLKQKDLDEAFFYWFGILAFVISIIGSGVAYAGLHLGDERMHEYRNKPGYGIGGVFLRVGRILVTLRRYLSKRFVLLFKPKIIEKEIEVEKIVEKIVEKPVIQEKIIEKEIEVPKQIEKKIFVHVPFPTDDPEVIKKGPMIYNDKDIEKGKK